MRESDDDEEKLDEAGGGNDEVEEENKAEVLVDGSGELSAVCDSGAEVVRTEDNMHKSWSVVEQVVVGIVVVVDDVDGGLAVTLGE